MPQYGSIVGLLSSGSGGGGHPTYIGLTSDTAQVIIDNNANTIQVDVISAGLEAVQAIQLIDSVISLKLNAAESNGLAITDEGLSLSEATSTTAGALSATDKVKLDLYPTIEGVENGYYLQKTDTGISWSPLPVSEDFVTTTNEKITTLEEVTTWKDW